MKRVLMLVALLVGVYLVTPAEAQGRFWVLVNGALRYNGAISVGNGTSVAPSYSFTSEPTLGFYRVGAGNVALVGGAATLTASSLQATAAGGFGWATKQQLGSSANGLMQIAQNSFLTVGYEINSGTAAPTATTCGTGTVTTHSNNMAGQITATGATTCTVTFGAPAWSFTPFCTATDVTTAAALRISAASATAITVTNLTSGDVFNWVCGGGAF